MFVRDTSFPESLFFISSLQSPNSRGRDADVVFVQQWGEIQYASDVPGEGGPIEELPFTGNFSTIDFTYWPDRKTYEALEFEPPGFVMGMLTRRVRKGSWLTVCRCLSGVSGVR